MVSTACNTFGTTVESFYKGLCRDRIDFLHDSLFPYVHPSQSSFVDQVTSLYKRAHGNKGPEARLGTKKIVHSSSGVLINRDYYLE